MLGLEAIFRWLHIFVGILWIGHLYYFNFVNGQMVAKLDAAAKKQVVPELMPRALYWFRWGAAWTWITGVLLLIMVYYAYAAENVSPDGWSTGVIVMIAVTFLGVFVYDAIWNSGLKSNVRAAVIVSFVILAAVVYLYVNYANFTYRATLIHTGALFGSAMAFNVWFRIWPAQQRIIRAIKAGEAPAAADPEHLRRNQRRRADRLERRHPELHEVDHLDRDANDALRPIARIRPSNDRNTHRVRPLDRLCARRRRRRSNRNDWV